MLVAVGGKTDQAAEEDADRLEAARLDSVGGLQLVGHVRRQNDPQEIFGALLLFLDLAQVRNLPIAEALLFESGADASAQKDRVERFGDVILGAQLDAADDDYIAKPFN